jgi:hypothetical protein
MTTMSELTTEQERLLDYLEKFKAIRGSFLGLKGWAYCGIEDFILQHGQWFNITPIPTNVIQGAPKCCFGNAIIQAALHGYRYIEGYATTSITAPLAFHHAWNADQYGNLIDSTWMNTGTAYIGIEFSLGRADSASWFDDATVLDNPGNRWKIFKEPWNGEDFSIKWPKSPALKSLRIKPRK